LTRGLGTSIEIRSKKLASSYGSPGNPGGTENKWIYHLLVNAYGATSLKETKNGIKKYMYVYVSVTGCRTKPQHKDS
jgi:hypothetical protein